MTTRGEAWRRRQHFRAIEAEKNGHTQLAKQIRADLWADAHREAAATNHKPTGEN